MPNVHLANARSGTTGDLGNAELGKLLLKLGKLGKEITLGLVADLLKVQLVGL
jgi:hypothetical protein